MWYCMNLSKFRFHFNQLPSVLASLGALTMVDVKYSSGGQAAAVASNPALCGCWMALPRPFHAAG